MFLRSPKVFCSLILICLGICYCSLHSAQDAPSSTPEAAQDKKEASKAVLPVPDLERIIVEPAKLVFEPLEKARQVVVTGFTSSGQRFDLTREARYVSPVPGMRVERGLIQPFEPVEAMLKIQAAGKEVTLEVDARKLHQDKEVSFVRDVMPVLTKTGCNAGTCHGAAKGKNGFRLSLRGYDPEYDWHTLVDDLAGRRFNRAASLMLLKPTNAVPHQGGYLFDVDSNYYRLLELWIAQGVRSDVETTSRATRLEVSPANIELDREGRAQQMLVKAYYEDGSSRDVTRDVSYSFSNTETASVTQEGLVTALRRGEGAILLRYEGLYANVPLMVMGQREGFQWQEVAQHNFIDKHVYAKLQRIQVLPAEICRDDEFIRRLYLDLTGQIPTPERVKAFLADTRHSDVKRRALIEELIGSPAYVDHWTHKWCDLLQVNRKFLGDVGAR
ncbi:MAG TPA: DUF1549 domain-containing protein, partial [Gemmatales bacterium]|nr:DUF1549 domain-containing protein [Gemmatales bacterium]